MEGSPDREAGNDVSGGVVEARVVAGLSAGEGDLGAFTLDKGVEGEVSGPVGEEVEGAAVGDEADLVMDKKRLGKRACCEEGDGMSNTYDGVRSDFTPGPVFVFA